MPTSFSAVEILNPDTVTVNDIQSVNGLDLVAGATLDLVSGGFLTVLNSVTGLGTVELDGTGGDPTLAINGTVFLLGPDPTVAAGGEILLNGPIANNLIMGVAGTDAKLVNAQDTIIGSGEIGQGDGNLTLVNGVDGTIDANVAGQQLVIDTGNAVTNGGALEATNGGILVIDDAVTNTGTMVATNGGTLDVHSSVGGTGSALTGDGGILEFRASVAATQTIMFADATGKLALADPADFHASVTGLVAGDTIDLTNIAPNSIESATIVGSALVVDVSGEASPLSFNIAGAITDHYFNVQSDGAGGSNLVLTLNGPLLIAGAAAQTLVQANAAAISGVSLSETGTTSGETFTATLTDTYGDLSANSNGPGGGGTITGSGTTSLTITGSLAQMNADLATLSDIGNTAAHDAITLTASDGFGNTAAQAIGVTVSALAPVIAVPGAQTLVQGNAAISGVSLSETGAFSGENFTVTLTDTYGDLSASGSGVSGSGTTSLTVTGTLAQVNADLATLSDTDNTAADDAITLTASDSLGNTAAQAIGITVNALAPVIAVPGADARARQRGGDLRRQLVGDRQLLRRELHGDADRHVWRPVGERQRGVGFRDDQPDRHRYARPGERRSGHARRHRQHGCARRHHAYRKRQFGQYRRASHRCDGHCLGPRDCRAGGADACARQCGGDLRRQPVRDRQLLRR